MWPRPLLEFNPVTPLKRYTVYPIHAFSTIPAANPRIR